MARSCCSRPAAIAVDDVQAEYERLRDLGSLIAIAQYSAIF